MSPTARTMPERRPAPRRKKKTSASGVALWWPLLVGIIVTPIAVHIAAVMALAGPGALQLLYPYVLVLQNHALGLPAELASNLSQLMMYLQFPIYGLLMSLGLRRGGAGTAFGGVVVTHFAAVFVLFLMAHM